MNKRLINILLAMGLVMSAFVGVIGTASADHADTGNGVIGHAYLPWVPNGAMLGDQGPFYGTVTVQNIESENEVEVEFHIGVGSSSTNYEHAETVLLDPNESITLSADALDIPEDGASVRVVGWLVHDGDEEVAGRIAAVAKNVSPQAADNAKTTSSHITVDGYSALTQDQVWSDEDQFVLPIVQTNDGWDTTVRVANFNWSGTGLANVTITLYGSAGQGFAGESQVINRQLRPGGVTSVTLSDYVPEGWVGSAFITSSADIGAVAERHKSNDDMLITNVSRPIFGEAGQTQYAALVFKEYNFWNTGISVANVSESSNNQVTIQYYGPTGNVVGVDTLNIPPRGMEFIYTPGTQDLGLFNGFVGSAKLTGTAPFHAAVDQVKYYGDDPDVGQAMSYIVDAEGAVGGETLALPLAQKGNPTTGTGDTSGIQLFNTQAGSHAEIAVTFYSAAGIPVAPTVDPAGDRAPIELDLAAHQSYTLYTHNLTEMSADFLGSATVDVLFGEVVGVSNNVNYAVGGDGSAAFNLIPVDQREAFSLEIDPEDAENVFGETHDVTVTVRDQYGAPVVGTEVTVAVTASQAGNQGIFETDLSDGNGQVTLSYDSNGLGIDDIEGSSAGLDSVFATKTWVEGDLVLVLEVECFEGADCTDEEPDLIEIVSAGDVSLLSHDEVDLYVILDGNPDELDPERFIWMNVTVENEYGPVPGVEILFERLQEHDWNHSADEGFCGDLTPCEEGEPVWLVLTTTDGNGFAQSLFRRSGDGEPFDAEGTVMLRASIFETSIDDVKTVEWVDDSEVVRNGPPPVP